MKAKNKGVTIANNTITVEPQPPLPPGALEALKVIAEALAANARALQECAERLGGPIDKRCGIFIKGDA